MGNPLSDIYHKTLAAIPDTVGGLLSGRSLTEASVEKLAVFNPDNGDQVTMIAQSSAADVDEMVHAAKASFDSGIWSGAAMSERQAVLTQAAKLIRENAEELAALDSVTTGLLYHRALKPHVQAAAGWFDYFADALDSIESERLSTLPDTDTVISREPAGVAALFTPWNIPLMGASLKLSAALAMGNSCVIKPSEQSPLGTIKLVQLLYKAGLPEGVLHLANGSGAITGDALASHADVDRVSFTGGENAGRIIAEKAASRFAKATMELGGKSANIIFADADYDRALDGAVIGAFANSGQACLAGSRILIERKIADRFIADFVGRTQSIRIGRPFDAQAEMGPQSSKAQMERVLSFAQLARRDGAQILTGGERHDGFPGGCYVKPTAVLAPSNDISICQEEIFGPFAAILVFDDEEQAISIANDTRFGLAGYVWTGDDQKAQRVAARMRTGYALINTPMLRDRNAPFGGFGHSGIDREGGRWSLDFYSEPKTIMTHHGHAPITSLGKSD